MTVDLALYQPDIALNTGTLLRLGACLGIHMHVIHPTGFVFSQRELRRSGLDYVRLAALTEHDSYAHFSRWRRAAGRRAVLLTTRGDRSAYETDYAEGDVLILGRESAGVPDSVAAEADLRVRIPMRPDLRSINVAVAAAMVLGEALRQTRHFGTLA